MYVHLSFLTICIYDPPTVRMVSVIQYTPLLFANYKFVCFVYSIVIPILWCPSLFPGDNQLELDVIGSM